MLTGPDTALPPRPVYPATGTGVGPPALDDIECFLLRSFLDGLSLEILPSCSCTDCSCHKHVTNRSFIGQTDRQISHMARCITFAVARICIKGLPLEIGEILHIFPLAPKVWETGDPKCLHGSEDRYIPADQIWL